MAACLSLACAPASEGESADEGGGDELASASESAGDERGVDGGLGSDSDTGDRSDTGAGLTEDEGSADASTEDSGGTETGGDETGDETGCPAGRDGCPCRAGLCDEGLVCDGERCGGCPKPDEAPCSGLCVDLGASDFNCGGCGQTCTVVLHAGHCDSGICGPTWSPCLDAGAPKACAEICAELGETCVEGGCLDDTVFVAASPGSCEAAYPSFTAPQSCEAVIEPVDAGAYRCCCTQ